MRIGILTLLLIAIIFGSGYWYTVFLGACVVPVEYRIGDINSRFSFSREALIRSAKEAEDIWEEKLGQDLFQYNESADFSIHLVFDERQQNAEREAELLEDLKAKEGMSDSVSTQYEKLIDEFRSLKKKYEARVRTYEANLSEHNSEVTAWNDKGGAPQDRVDELNETEASLTKERDEIETLAEKLNSLAVQLNAIGAKGNSLITDYNEIVNEYNDEFSEPLEFTQGDYTGDAINIYQFDSEDELTIVLAHEFGHALSLEHVGNEKSIMYHFMGKQDSTSGISPEDIAEFHESCDQKTKITKFLKVLVPFF